MANHKRKKSRINTRTNVDRMSSTPNWWNLLMNTRPSRRRASLIVSKIKKDVLVWEYTSFEPYKKPHTYYW